VFISLNGQWYTPPVSDGVLPGIMREVLLEDAQMMPQERHLTRADLLAADQIILCNSLRGQLTAQLQLD